MKGFDKKRWIAAGIAVIMAAAMPVSYTPLTLPTSNHV